jgi:hypothetical protein
MGITPRRQRGQVLIVFALTVTSMLAVVGVLYTFGLVLDQRRVLQAGADATSLRGSWQVLRELASDDLNDTRVQIAVTKFATDNGSPPVAGYPKAVYIDAYGQEFCPSVAVGAAPGGSVPFKARGVQVTLQNQVPTLLPNFLSGMNALSVRATARATARPSTLAKGELVLPIAVSETEAQSAYSSHGSYNLFGVTARTLDLTKTKGPGSTSNPALSYGSPATNAQFWSDGRHSGTWQMSQPGTVDVADGAYHAEIATGLHDNVIRQNLLADTGGAYALLTVPLYSGSAPLVTAAIVGFAQFKIRDAAITPASAVGTFVPYAVAPYGTVAAHPAVTPCVTPSLPGDFGAALVSIVS